MRREPDGEARRSARRRRRDRVPPDAASRDTVLYGPDEPFEIGGSRILRSSDEDEIALVGAGITVHEALAAADLAEEGISARVIDLYSIKPLDRETLLAAAEATDGRIVTVEDHWPEGGLGEAVLSASRTRTSGHIVSLAVRELPSSGKPEELLAAAGIDADHIAAAAGSSWPSARRAPLGSGAPDIAVLIASDLRKEFSGDPLFDGVSFTVGRRDRLSLAGPNGPGRRRCSARSRARRRCRAANSPSRRARGSRCTTSDLRSSST